MKIQICLRVKLSRVFFVNGHYVESTCNSTVSDIGQWKLLSDSHSQHSYEKYSFKSFTLKWYIHIL